MWVAGKLCDPSLTRPIAECIRDEFLVIKRYTKSQIYGYFTLIVRVDMLRCLIEAQPVVLWHLRQCI